MDLRLEIDAERLSPVPILMLLDREADVYLAQQAGAQGWLVKPLDSFRLKMAAVALLAGEDMRELRVPALLLHPLPTPSDPLVTLWLLCVCD